MIRPEEFINEPQNRREKKIHNEHLSRPPRGLLIVLQDKKNHQKPKRFIKLRGMNMLGTYMRAVRNERYKLVRLHPCDEQLFDLAADPLELTDLLQTPMDTRELAAYSELVGRLNALH